MNLRSELDDELIKRNIDKGEFGLEKESLRIDGDGFLSHTKHPFAEEHNIGMFDCEIERIEDLEAYIESTSMY